MHEGMKKKLTDADRKAAMGSANELDKMMTFKDPMPAEEASPEVPTSDVEELDVDGAIDILESVKTKSPDCATEIDQAIQMLGGKSQAAPAPADMSMGPSGSASPAPAAF